MKYKRPMKYAKGGATPLSPKAVKEYVMKVRGWTSEQYIKERDILKNKLRAYESLTRAQGGSVESQSPSTLLYKQARSMKKYGKDYKPTAQLRAIEATPAYSITKGRKVAKNTESAGYKRFNSRIEKQVKSDFSEFIKNHPQAQAIVEKYSGNGVKLKEALKSYANQVKAASKNGVPSGGTTPEVFGEVVGSPDKVEFDYDAFEASFGK